MEILIKPAKLNYLTESRDKIVKILSQFVDDITARCVRYFRIENVTWLSAQHHTNLVGTFLKNAGSVKQLADDAFIKVIFLNTVSLKLYYRQICL